MFNFNWCRENHCDCKQWNPCQEHRNCRCNSWFNFNQCNKCHQRPCDRPCHNNDWDNKCKPCRKCDRMNDWNGFRQDDFDSDDFQSNNFNFSNFNRGGCSNVRPIFIDNNTGSFGNGCEVSIINPTFTAED